MKDEIVYTLLSEGSSDKALIPILDWLLHQILPENISVNGKWADLRLLPDPPKSLEKKISLSVSLYPCNVLFVHRDADKSGYLKRKEEIENALSKCDNLNIDYVCVIPVRMMEAWLLISADDILMAAENPNGNISGKMPKIKELESISDPKKTLYDLLKYASGLSGARLKKFRPNEKIHYLAEIISDFSALRHLDAFVNLESDIKDLLLVE